MSDDHEALPPSSSRSADSQPSSRLHQFRRRVTNSETYRNYGRRLRYYSLKRRKPLGIAAISVLLLCCFLAAILVVVLTKTGGKRPLLNPDAEIVTFLFNVGYKGAMVDPGRLVLKKAINGLAGNITRGQIAVTLVPYADGVLADRVEKNLQDVNVTQKAIERLFDEGSRLKGNPSQFDALNYYLNGSSSSAQNQREEELFINKRDEFSVLGSSAPPDKGSFVFLAPRQDLYDSEDARIQDAHETGRLISKVKSQVAKTFLVGLDGNTNMKSDYRLDDDTDIVVLPDGVNEVDQIVDDIQSDNPAPLPTSSSTTVSTPSISTSTPSTSSTTVSTPSTEASSSSSSSTQSSTPSSSTSTQSTVTEELTTDYYSTDETYGSTDTEPPPVEEFDNIPDGDRPKPAFYIAVED